MPRHGCGLRPLRAVGSRLYEPEAVGAIGAYSPTRRARVYEPEAAPEGKGEKIGRKEDLESGRR
jgi:hypothetical protein